MKESSPFRLGLALWRVARQIEPAVQEAAERERGELIPRRNAEGEAQPDTVEIADPAACHAELDTLRRTRIRLQVEPLTLEELSDPGPDVAPRVLMALGELIDDHTPAALA